MENSIQKEKAFIKNTLKTTKGWRKKERYCCIKTNEGAKTNCVSYSDINKTQT